MPGSSDATRDRHLPWFFGLVEQKTTPTCPWREHLPPSSVLYLVRDAAAALPKLVPTNEFGNRQWEEAERYPLETPLKVVLQHPPHDGTPAAGLMSLQAPGRSIVRCAQLLWLATVVLTTRIHSTEACGNRFTRTWIPVPVPSALVIRTPP